MALDRAQAAGDPAVEVRPATLPFAAESERFLFRLHHLCGVLFGHAASICMALRARRLLPVAVLLTLSAGLAREYDGEYLVAQPWFLFVPLLVASALGSILWMLLERTSWRFCRAHVTAGESWRGFITCYLLTAPAAWLYAIPFERFFDETTATRCNLTTLTIVSCWRVLVITRVAAVLYRRPYGLMLFPVLLFSSTATILGTASPIHLVELMAGIRLTEVEQLVMQFRGIWAATALWTWPFALIGSIFVLSTRPAAAAGLAPAPTAPTPLNVYVQPIGLSRAVTWTAIASIFVWILPIAIPARGPQSEQRLRHEVETRFARGEVESSLRFLAIHAQNKFPPHWQPPPRGLGIHEQVSLIDVVERLDLLGPTHWSRQDYVDRVVRLLENGTLHRIADVQQRTRLFGAILRLPEARQIAARAREGIEFEVSNHPTGIEAAAELLQLP